jgi:hypothetical protein
LLFVRYSYDMAISIALQSATPYALKYLVTYDGAGGAGSATVDRTRLQMIADLTAAGVKSPLKELLEATTDDVAWDTLSNGPDCSLYERLLNGFSAIVISDLQVVADPIGKTLRVSGTDGTAYVALVELRYNHTYDR